MNLSRLLKDMRSFNVIIDTDKILKYLDESPVAAYSIAKETGLSRTLILELRKRKKDVVKLRIENAIKILDYFEKGE